MNVTEDKKHQVAQQLCSILETQAFVLVDPVDPPSAPEPPRSSDVAVALRVHQAPIIEVLLVASSGLAVEALEALDDAPGAGASAQARIEDALGELVNVATNHVLDLVLGPEYPYTVSPPYAVTVDQACLERLHRHRVFTGRSMLGHRLALALVPAA